MMKFIEVHNESITHPSIPGTLLLFHLLLLLLPSYGGTVDLEACKQDSKPIIKLYAMPFSSDILVSNKYN